MNYPNTAVQRSNYRQAPRRRKTRRFVVDWTKLAMLIIPIVLLAFLLTLTFGSHGTDETPKPDTVQAQGNSINLVSNTDGNLPSVSLLPYTQEVTEKPKTEVEIAPIYTEREVEMIAKTIWGEARGVKSTTEKAAVAWCILNRVDGKGYGCGGDIEYVLTVPDQFVGYNENNPVTAECKEIAEDVLKRWAAEKEGAEDAGRVLPKQYKFFNGDGKRNYFTDEWKGGNTWDWSLRSPYED